MSKVIAWFGFLILLPVPWGFSQQAGPHVILWAVCHPFRVQAARQAGQEAIRLVDSLGRTGDLDGRIAGGNADAFRHAYWMWACRARMGYHAAKWLGAAHERDNRRDARRGKREDAAMADAVAGEMDARNNAWTLAQSRLPGQIPVGRAARITRVLADLRAGRLWMIRMNAAGQSLDCAGQVIPDAEWQGKWINARCLEPSH